MMFNTKAELMRFLRKNPPARKFVPYCYLSKETDTLTMYFEGDADYSKKLSDHVTVCISLETDEIVGCKIEEISALLEDLPNYIQVKRGKIALPIILLAFWGSMRKEETSKAMSELICGVLKHKMILEPNI